jgi:DNA-binding GntR family transcriptional regulator
MERFDHHGHAARDAYYALIARFDAAQDEAASNNYLTAALRTIRTHLVRVRRLARDHPDRLAASVGEHRQIAAAIAARDPELAAHATHLHLHNALAGILDSLGEGSRPETTTRGAA